MKIPKLFSLLIIISIAGQANSQILSKDVENTELISTKMQEHTIQRVGEAEYNAVLRQFQNDLRDFGAAAINLESDLNENGIERLKSLDLDKIQSNAIRPYYDSICKIMKSNSPDMIAVARFYQQAKSAEAFETEAAYDSTLAEFDDQGFQAISNLKSEIDQYSITLTVNWEAVALDLPLFSKQMFLGLCKQHLDPDYQFDLGSAADGSVNDQSDIRVIRN
jgi:cellulase/cellobiase CelA1